MAQTLGIAEKTVASYEQKKRNILAQIERQIFFLFYMMKRGDNHSRPCWLIKNCPQERVKQCPAWKFRAGDCCWMMNGTICDGAVHENWHEKMRDCRTYKVFPKIFQNVPTPANLSKKSHKS
jgi:hypothetical protein